MPRRAPHPYLCPFHARKEAQALAAQRASQDIAYYLSSAYTSACDLNSALGRLFVAVANGEIKPKAAATLAYLGQTMVQNLHLAQHEYINAFGSTCWRETIRESYDQITDRISPPPAAPDPADASAPFDSSDPEAAGSVTPSDPLEPGMSAGSSGSIRSADAESDRATTGTSEPQASSDPSETEEELNPVK